MFIPMFGRCVAKQYLSILEKLIVKYSLNLLHFILMILIIYRDEVVLVIYKGVRQPKQPHLGTHECAASSYILADSTNYTL
jgi:hypothetical protein